MATSMAESELFTKYKCLDCGIALFCCTLCEDYFFTKMYHWCETFDRCMLLLDLYPTDEGFEEPCQKKLSDCGCNHPCKHYHLLKIVQLSSE